MRVNYLTQSSLQYDIATLRILQPCRLRIGTGTWARLTDKETSRMEHSRTLHAGR